MTSIEVILPDKRVVRVTLRSSQTAHSLALRLVKRYGFVHPKVRAHWQLRGPLGIVPPGQRVTEIDLHIGEHLTLEPSTQHEVTP